MDENEFGTFRSTYRITSFLLCITMMYPNRNTIKQRLLGFALETLFFLPMVLILLFNTFDCLIRRDILNLTHHSTVVGPYFGGLIKIVISNYRALEGEMLIAEIDRDYAMYNTLPEKYHIIVRGWIRNSQIYAEKFWNLMVAVSGFTYLSMTVFVNIKSQLYNEIPKRTHIHDALIPFADPDLRFQTPYFEFMFGQCMIGALLITIYYLGFDSFFALALNHACLKIEIFCELLVDAMEVKNKKKRLKKIEFVIKEHLRLFTYIETVQNFFNIYLGIVLFATLIQIGTCLYHITENEEQDYQRLMITVVAIGAIYLPCYYSSKLKLVANDSATKFYFAGWHKVPCITTRKIVLFMIARAQISVLIMGFNFIIFDMQLFLSILQSAYSIYTLLCS
ncbi:uncharacterized protein LOC121728145 [Aricia agestis]|uniref:uncharacterized protein LOC121728145 n=1 Tax=Aricia agestis TaxID=91739 RepID=UPI001C203AE8|nr:uncharacterized protein LOC121728145 [Aricia agestis]